MSIDAPVLSCCSRFRVGTDGGQDAFNKLQVLALPKLYQPPHNTYVSVFIVGIALPLLITPARASYGSQIT